MTKSIIPSSSDKMFTLKTSKRAYGKGTCSIPNGDNLLP